jgi:hypothetical protein
MTDADIVREFIHHAGEIHSGSDDALAALDALEAEIRSLNEQVVGAVDLLEGAVAERDEALARLSSIGGYEGYDNAWTALQRRAEAAEAEVARLEKDNKWLRILLGRWASDYPDLVTEYDRAALGEDA